MSAAALARKTSDTAHARSTAAPRSSGELRIGESHDVQEQEAERVAPETKTGGAAGRHWLLPRLSGGMAPPIVHSVLRSPGQPLDGATRQYFEPRFGRDLSTVRVHADAAAASSAGAVHARAYTVGNHIAFADREFAPATSAGRALLGHELVHVAQQANAPIYLARSEPPYVSPYNDALAAELLERLRQLRVIEAASSTVPQSRRVGAVAAVFDRQGNRIDIIGRMNVPGGAHAEELVVREIQNRIAAGQKIEYTVLMIDQDPCLGTCTPLLKEWRGNPASGSLRVVTPMAVSKRDPSQMVSGKTAYQRALTQDEVPFKPKTPPPGNAAFIGPRDDLSRVRPPLYKGPDPSAVTGGSSSVPGTGAAGDAAGDVGGDATAAATKALGKTEQRAAGSALEDAAAARLTKQLTQTAEKDVAEKGAEAFTRSATSAATRRLGQAVAPVVGAAFAAPDAWKGMQDLAHGNVVLGLGTIGVAIVDVAAQGLHLTDEITAGGGTILAITIQTWAATMQFGFESARIKMRADELKAYIKAHGGMPSRDELMSYYGLNDEDILLLEHDVYAPPPKVSTQDLAKQVRDLLAQIDANANAPLPEGVTPASLQKERATLGRLLVALEAQVEQERAQGARERAAADEKRRQANFDRAQQQQKQLQKPAATQQAAAQILPGPGVSQQKPAPQNDPFGLLGPTGPQPLSGISVENAELAGTGFGRIRNALRARYQQLESEHFPSDKVKTFQNDVAAYVGNLDRTIAEFMKKGSAEWPGVKEMRRLRDAADNDDRSKLMR